MKLLILIFGLIACTSVKSKIQGDWTFVKSTSEYESIVTISRTNDSSNLENRTTYSFKRDHKFFADMVDYTEQGEYYLINDSTLRIKVKDKVSIFKLNLNRDILMIHLDSINSPFMYFVRR